MTISLTTAQREKIIEYVTPSSPRRAYPLAVRRMIQSLPT